MQRYLLVKQDGWSNVIGRAIIAVFATQALSDNLRRFAPDQSATVDFPGGMFFSADSTESMESVIFQLGDGLSQHFADSDAISIAADQYVQLTRMVPGETMDHVVAAYLPGHELCEVVADDMPFQAFSITWWIGELQRLEALISYRVDVTLQVESKGTYHVVAANEDDARRQVLALIDADKPPSNLEYADAPALMYPRCNGPIDQILEEDAD